MEKLEVQIHPSLLAELVVDGQTFRSTCDLYVTEADLEKARTQLKETDAIRKFSLKKLKEMLSEDHDMVYRMDDEYLLRFLRYKKFDIKKAYKHIRHFYKMRNDDPELFLMPPDIESRLAGKFNNIMPYTEENGRLIFIHRFAYWNPEETSIRDLLTMFSYVSDVMSMNPHAQIHGAVVVWDFGGTGVSHISRLVHPSSLRLWTKFVQDVYPWRIKKVVLFNCHDLLYAALTTIRLFLKQKLADRLVLMRSDLTQLHEHINPALLPKEYGGYLDDDECNDYLKRVIFSNKKYLKYENSFIVSRNQ